MHDWTALSGHTLSAEEVSTASAVDLATTRAVLDAFTAPASPCNEGFASIGDFNLVSAQLLLRTDDGHYVSLQAYGLLEALYDSPFYWMLANEAYRDQASAHRGDFTEDFVAARLGTVFGSSNVHRGVTVWRGTKRVTDIDVLVTFADRALVLQCKSKRLTLDARRGNDLQLRNDFRKAVQDAYDQARISADALGDGSLRFELADGIELNVMSPRAAYPICVVSDHYPALTVQSRHFLHFTTDDVVRPPLATDVFMIDVLAEMLESPLRFLSYIDRRVSMSARVTTINEFAVLGFHLSNNLWLDPQYSLAMISDECSIDLDTAMTVRREGVPGRRTPKGFLDRFGATLTGRILTGIERSEDPSLVNLGLMLLTMGADTLVDLDAGLEQLAARTRKDGQTHDFTLVFDGTSAGLTVHCSSEPTPDAVETLGRHCERRKYLHRADQWFGLLVRMDDGMPKVSTELRSPWRPDTELEEATRAMAARDSRNPPKRRLAHFDARRVGRNDPCPCGSGRKYKKCCLP